MTRRPPFAALLLALTFALSALAPAQELTPPPLAEGEKLRVEVSFLLIDVMRILDAEQEVEADFFYEIEWNDPRLADEGAEFRRLPLSSVWAPTLQPVAPRGVSSLMPDLVSVDPDGNASYVQRLSGKFGAPTYLADFPFDSHTLRFPFFFSSGKDIDFDPVPGDVVEMSEKLSITDWTISNDRLSVEPIVLSDQIPPIEAATFIIEAKRNSSHYLFTVMLPLLVVVMMSWTVFWAPPAQINIQFGFAATSILTLIAYRFALANQVPPLPYSTRLDAFLNGAFILAYFALLEVILTARLIYRDRTDLSERVDFHARWIFPVLLACVATYAFVA